MTVPSAQPRTRAISAIGHRQVLQVVEGDRLGLAPGSDRTARQKSVPLAGGSARAGSWRAQRRARARASISRRRTAEVARLTATRRTQAPGYR